MVKKAKHICENNYSIILNYDSVFISERYVKVAPTHGCKLRSNYAARKTLILELKSILIFIVEVSFLSGFAHRCGLKRFCNVAFQNEV